jgi:hypothetical protein
MPTESESEPTPQPPQYGREQVVDGLRPLVDRGFSNPDDLPADDPEVQQAQAAYFAWNKQERSRAGANPDPAAFLEYQLSASTLYLDAGFSDPDYVDEVANDWLAQDLERAESEGFNEVAAKIQAKIDELNASIDKPEKQTVVQDTNLEAREFAARPDVSRNDPVLVECSAFEASALYAWLKNRVSKDERNSAAIEDALTAITEPMQAAGLKQDRVGAWQGSGAKAAETIRFPLSPEAALLAQQTLRPLYADDKKRAAQKIYRTVYDQVSAPEN